MNEICRFIHVENASIGNGNICKNKAKPNHNFCLDHLKLFTSNYVRAAVIFIVSDELCIEPNLIKNNSNIQDDFGADSMALVNLNMRIEDELDIEIADDQSEKLKTIDQIITFIINKFFSEEKYIVKTDFDFHNNWRPVREKSANFDRHINSFLGSSILTEIINNLSLSVSAIRNILLTSLRESWIEHVTTVIKENKEKKIESVDYILLTEKFILFLKLEKQKCETRIFYLNDFSVSCSYLISDNGTITSMILGFKYNYQRNEKNDFNEDYYFYKYSFVSDAGIIGAQNFIKKYYKFRDDMYEKNKKS